MSAQDLETYTVQPESIRFNNLGSIEYLFSLKKPSSSNSKILVLSENLPNTKGGILYPKGTSVTADKIDTLQRMKKKNPDLNDSLVVEKSDEFAKFIAGIIKEDISTIIKSRSQKDEFKKSYIRIEKFIEKYADDILEHKDFAFILFNARSINHRSHKGGAPVHFFHSLNTAIISTIILQNTFFAFGKKFSIDDIITVARAALLYDIGALLNYGPIANLPRAVLKTEFTNLNVKSAAIARSIGLDDVVADCIKKAYEFETLAHEDIINDDSTVADYAKTVSMANRLDLKISGLFEEPIPLSKALDEMYLLANKGKLNKNFVDSLAKGLKLNELFDFYFELARLRKACLKPDNARPYPLIGFKSPILILCKGKRIDCPQYVSASSSVTLLKKSGDLQPGKYGRCKFLSKALVSFYEKHYETIKSEMKSDSVSFKK